ncbi:hypothetical protein KRX57_03365 [Weeksellaceae bacterium TAE3-ERU29]|nr:hypothetical protein [Weeksellaceae bacterium TAE3-ERU29]
MNIKLYLRWAFAYFLIIILLGSSMRWSFVLNILSEYRYILHTHSHIALLGWVYIGLTALLAKDFLPKTTSKTFKWIFWITQITILGMLFSFPFQGYGMYSIIFSSLFLVVSYVFSVFFILKTPKELKTKYSYKWIRLAIICMIISSIGPWALGYIMVKFGKDSPLYRGAIYFYLHFQYNGWMLSGIVGLFIRYIEQKRITFSNKTQKYSLWLFGLGIFLSLPLSWTGLVNIPLFYLIGGIGVFLQIIATVILLKEFLNHENSISNHYKGILKLISVLFFLKLGMQLLSAIPYIGQITFFNIDIVIGYLHFIFLGIISLSILYFLLIYKEIKIPNWTLCFYILLFFLTEGLIFYKGLILFAGVPLFSGYFLVLAIVSTLFLIPVSVFFLRSLKRN